MACSDNLFDTCTNFLFSKVELFFCFEILDLNQNKWIYQTADICGFTPNFHDFIALVTLSTVGSTLVQTLSYGMP